MAPSEYLAKLEAGSATTPPIPGTVLNEQLRSHLIAPDLLRGDRFEEFMADRQARLLRLMEQAREKQVYGGTVAEEGVDVEVDDNEAEAELTIAAT